MLHNINEHDDDDDDDGNVWHLSDWEQFNLLAVNFNSSRYF